MIRGLIDRNRIPPGGFQFHMGAPHNITLEEPTFLKLVNAVSHFHTVNKIVIPKDLPSVIDQQLCSTMPDGWCKNISEGLGDTIYKLTQATGIQAIKRRKLKSRGVCAGCARRQATANKLVSYRKR